MSVIRSLRSRRWTPEQARTVLDEIERRGVPIRRFADERGVGVERLYRWKRRLAQTDPPRPSPLRFTEVTVRPSAPAGAIEIELDAGIHVRVSGESRVEDVVAILSRLPRR